MHSPEAVVELVPGAFETAQYLHAEVMPELTDFAILLASSESYNRSQ